MVNTKEYKEQINALIDQRRLREAIAKLEALCDSSGNRAIKDKLERTAENYRLMLKYVSLGVSDPERDQIYRNIVNELYDQLDAAIFEAEKLENSSQYYSKIRTREHNQRLAAFDSLLEGYRKCLQQCSIYQLSNSNDNPEAIANRSQMEGLQRELFYTLWTLPQIDSAIKDSLISLLSYQEFSPEFKSHMLSALTLGLLQRFDPKKLSVLFTAYSSNPDIRVQAVALVGLLFALWRYPNRPLDTVLSEQLALAAEAPNWHNDLRLAYIEMIRATDTERINNKIQNEVIPDMMNLRPEIMNKVNSGELKMDDMASLQANPEWQELMDKNGITDKLKELTEMQLEGADVMMSTFAHLKNFAFFQEVANWFLPFDINHTALAKVNAKLGVMSEMIEAAMFLCDNDKYSFMLTLNMVPEEQRSLMTSQFQAQSDNIYQSLSEMANAPRQDSFRKALNVYMQNIYRFFKLYRDKAEFFDPFAKSINLIAVPSLAEDFDDADMLAVVAEFYFKLGYMSDALKVFERLERVLPGDASRYQKMGYAHEHLRQYQEAIKCYERAQLLEKENAWTLRRLAAAYRAIGDNDKALRYYSQLVNLQPDDMSAALLLGYVLLERNDYDGAISQFYKVEFLDEKGSRAWRPLAWTLFLKGKLDDARKYYEKVLAYNPSGNDYLNLGHVALASGDMRDAINNYKMAVGKYGAKGAEKFIEAIEQDRSALAMAGIELKLVPLIIDAVLS